MVATLRQAVELAAHADELVYNERGNEAVLFKIDASRLTG